MSESVQQQRPAYSLIPIGSLVCVELRKHRCSEYTYNQFLWGVLLTMDKDFVGIRGTRIDIATLAEDPAQVEFALGIIPWQQIAFVNASRSHKRNGRMVQKLSTIALEIDKVKVIEEEVPLPSSRNLASSRGGKKTPAKQ